MKRLDQWINARPNFDAATIERMPAHVWRGRSIFIELKTPTGRMSNVQTEMARALTLAGAVFTVCRSVDEVSDFLAGAINMKGRLAA